MAEILGTLILGEALAGSVAFSIGTTAVTYGTIAGTAALIGASAAAAGISAALAPDAPKAEGGHLTQNKTIPARQFVYGRCRIAGNYMLYEAVNSYSVDVVALCQGPICGFVGYFLNDDRANVVSENVVGMLNPGGSPLGTGIGINDGRYAGRVTIETRLGLATETAYSDVTTLVGAGTWDSSHRGDGIASLALVCNAPSTTKFTKSFPAGLPSPSAIVDGLALWDFRDPAQDPEDPTTWVDYPAFDFGETIGTAGVRRVYGGVVYISQQGSSGAQPDISPQYWVSAFSNPVLQIVDYLIDTDHGMGLDRTKLIDPVKSDLGAQANICDELVDTFAAWDSGTTYGIGDERIYAGGVFSSLQAGNIGNTPSSSPFYWAFEFFSPAQEPRYKSDGFFSFDNEPADVLASILATCAGWMAQDVDGTLALRVGRYTSPMVTLGQKHILGGEVRRGLAEKDSVNEFQITFTDPNNGYKSEPGAPYRDEDDISSRGKVLSKPLQLTLVQSQTQARRLAKRQMEMFQSGLRGTLITTTYALAALGERYIALDWPVHGLNDQPVEVQRIEIDLLADRATLEWVAVDPATIDAFDPAVDGNSSFLSGVLRPVYSPLAQLARGVSEDWGSIADSIVATDDAGSIVDAVSFTVDLGSIA